MRRLSDHFKYCLALEQGQPELLLPAENSAARPPLVCGTFHGHRLWFHLLDHPYDCGNTILTFEDDLGRIFHADDAIACLQYEHYLEPHLTQVGTRGVLSKWLYYFFKPWMPRALQLLLQRANARQRRRSVDFPAWPQDSTLVDLMSVFLAECMRVAGIDSVPFLGFWPRGKTWAWGLSHDVDTGVGYSNHEDMARVDEEHGVCSAWYFVPERYPIDLCRLEELRARGHEIGLHGLKHSGKLFSSRAEFESRLPRINHYVRLWRVRGFRSPATFRNAYWLTEIDVDYDSSYMDNARFEPQPGGVCAPFPFMLSQRLVELPITLPMDHTLINVLRQDVVPVCEQKVAWIRQQYGLALSLFHPEYNSGSRALDRYARVVEGLARDPRGWYALPQDIADWWQRRRHSHVVVDDHGEPVIVGPAAPDGSIWWAYRDRDTIRIEPPRS